MSKKLELTAPAITPVPEDVRRPMWSVMIPVFNCANYLRQTLASVLAQDPGPERMQIEVVDDMSTKDDPEAVVREVGKGRVAFFRKPKNGGATANFNTWCISFMAMILCTPAFMENLKNLPGFTRGWP